MMQLRKIAALGAAAAGLALPAAATGQAPSGCPVGGATGDPVQDCYKATGIGDAGLAEHFVAEWSAPSRTVVVLPGVPNVVCQLLADEAANGNTITGNARMSCDHPVPADFTVTIRHENGLLTPTLKYLYSYTDTTCAGEQFCYTPTLVIGGSSGATYRDAARFEIRTSALFVAESPWCVHTHPDTVVCWATDVDESIVI
jgi:hypothetical protein